MPVLSEKTIDSSWNGARGIITDFIDQPANRWQQFEGYLCGPPPMVDAGIAKLCSLGVPLTQIFYDKFTDGAD